MEEKEIFSKIEKARKDRILDIYLESDFKGEGIIITKTGHYFNYTWKYALKVETQQVIQIYDLKTKKIELKEIIEECYKIVETTNSDKCINVIELENLKIENNDPKVYKQLYKKIKEVLKCQQSK